jgi:tubulin-specific chaperone A
MRLALPPFRCCGLYSNILRLLKEVSYYEQEVKENEGQLAEMKAEKKDPYDIKKFEEVLGESYMMVPDSKSRFEQTLRDLASYVESSEVEDHKSNEWYIQAKDLLAKELERLDKAEDEVKETNVDDLEEGETF